MKNTITKNALFGTAILALAFVAFMIALPAQANAQVPLYWDNGHYYSSAPHAYDSYCPSPQTATVSANGYYTCSYPSGPSYQTAPIYTQPIYTQPTYQNLSASCYAVNSASIPTGGAIQWTATANGGNGSYSYTWSGTDGLSGAGQSITMNYYSQGAKTASVTVYSAGQSITVNCGNSVTVYNNSYSYNYGYTPTTYYPSLSATCSASTASVPLGTAVMWNAQATGGNGYYQYTWSGTDGVSGNGQSIYYNYNQPGVKYASVTVYSNGQTITQPCNNAASVGVGQIIGYGVNTNNELDIACYADPNNADINTPITWTAEVTGGAKPFTYSWTGTDGLSGEARTALKYYSTRGTKTAVVTVKSADGKTGTHACSTSIASRTSAVVTTAPVTNVQPTSNNSQSNLGAAAIFSLGNVPWGWVAILIILILFAMVMYLLFNRPKM